MDAGVCGIDPGLGIMGYAVLRDADGISVLDASILRVDKALAYLALFTERSVIYG